MSFQNFRDGKGEDWLEIGRKALAKTEVWVKNSQVIFESKLYLMEAEHYASNCHIVAAKESFVLSAKTARDHGLVHEQGLAFEARECYMQWEAIAKAEWLQEDCSFSLHDESHSVCLQPTKRPRDEYGEELI
ncbi:hypothetical protein ACHAWF_009286 [Thalassiosira exigua]